MPIIKVDDGDQFEDVLVSEGEYDLTITKAEKKKSKAGNDMISTVISIEGSDEENPAPIFFHLVIPAEGDEWYRLHMRTLMRFLAVFGISDIDTDDEDSVAELNGATGKCFVKQEENNDSGDMQNALVLPKIRG